VEEPQDMENMELCISTPSTIRSHTSSPIPKPTNLQSDEIEQWTHGATEIRAQQTWDHFDKEVWHYNRIVKILKTREGVEELAAYKFTIQPLQCTHTPVVKQKFIYRDTTFFLKPTSINLCTNWSTNQNSKYACNAADYLISLDFNKTNIPTIAKIVQYYRGFMQHKSKLEFDEMRKAILDAFTDILADLPASLDGIPNEIRKELPFELPIHDRANTRPLWSH
ncbi:8069_t:CDS:2, partial [Gigaspora rosea]